MNYGICALSAVPVRAEASDKAELVTELLFGDCYTVLLTQGNWLRIEIAADNYLGWIDFKQHCPVSPVYFQAWCAQDHPRALDVVQVVSDAATRQPITLGCRLPFFDGMTLRLGDDRPLFYNGQATNTGQPCQPERQLALLRKMGQHYLRAPYVWGGKSIFGLDCSGLTQQLFGLVGVQLPRDARQQIERGETVDFVTQARPGDLAFFDNADGAIVHVGLVLDDSLILHAHGEVRLDPLDHHGIFNRDRQKYSHKLRLIKRVL
ncbi:C40 family peptidase [Hymenobacter ginkgonis]|uniref:C40 family peptidase n=1 Tax=Hymenobacter ginkgonis TaxID=2682976 RepID=UPI0012FA2361|nr:C40 family peptidase [Hymenobacter ginkgonis]